ncbi:PHD finger protein 11, partial [Colius striatus]
LFSSGFVESEEYNPENLDIRFDVASVLKELKRGKRLVCNFCRKKGATVGCEERACRRSYHYFCALCDDAAIETDEVNGVYRYLTQCLLTICWVCPRCQVVSCPSTRKARIVCFHCEMRLRHSVQPCRPPPLDHSWVRVCLCVSTVRIDFVRKCKQAGLLDDIFEEMLDTLHLAQEKLMDDNTSETGRE